MNRGTTGRGRGRLSPADTAELDRAIKEAALEQFLERGYDGTTMDSIAAAASTTKASVYARYATKAELFRFVLDWVTQRDDWPLPEPDPPDLDDLEGALITVAYTALERALNPSMISLQRIAQTGMLPESAHRWSLFWWPRRQVVVDLLNHHAAAGAITVHQPEILAELFLGMVASAPARLASFGVQQDPDQLRQRTDMAVQLFLTALRTGISPKQTRPLSRRR
jgi:AcrR family transcriptional regulator